MHVAKLKKLATTEPGTTRARAMKVAQEIESLCEVYLKALAVGEPAVLTREQMDEVIERFGGYGKAAARQ